MSSICSSRFPIPCACRALALSLVALALGGPAAAQRDEGIVDELARLLAAADTRVYDTALFREALRYFDGSTWHRVVPNFVVQDGDPRGDGWGGPGFALRDEMNPMRYETGTVGMALSGPDTGGSQFFITHSPQPHLDGIYTVFGRVVSGLGALAAIGQGERIRSIHR